jgi:hypothetical protein
MLQKKVFIFFARKTHFFYFLSGANRCFSEGATKIPFENWAKTISKNIRTLRVQNSALG